MPRPTLPTATKMLAGTVRKHRLNLNEPSPERAIPVPPAKLGAKARQVWQQVAQVLDEMGVLTVADTFALEALSHDLADLRQTRADLKARGSAVYTTTSRDGSIMHRAYPEVQMISDLDRRVAVWLPKLGLTPADRGKVTAIVEDEDANAFADL